MAAAPTDTVQRREHHHVNGPLGLTYYGIQLSFVSIYYCGSGDGCRTVAFITIMASIYSMCFFCFYIRCCIWNSIVYYAIPYLTEAKAITSGLHWANVT